MIVPNLLEQPCDNTDNFSQKKKQAVLTQHVDGLCMRLQVARSLREYVKQYLINYYFSSIILAKITGKQSDFLSIAIKAS